MGNAFPHRVLRHTVLLGQSRCGDCAARVSGLFSDLPESAFDTHHGFIEHFSLPAKSVLFREGDAGRYVYTLRSGVIKLVQRAPNGAPRIVGLMHKGDTVGLGALGGLPYRHGAEALEASEVCRIPVETLRLLRASHPQLAEQIFLRQQKSVDAANQIITLLSTGSAQGRVVRCILHTLSTDGSDTCPAMCREDMAALISVTVETVSRIVADFKRQGLIVERHSRFYLDRAGLEKFAEG
ncbi:MAG: Crp/Fnr family transcriptional regulator [Rhodocyclaceae bacterium]|nr:Crp/Fnr family transcriptional regulator [Rhodocyclaceae bacterium]